MAPAEETEPRYALRALCLFAVLVIAKILMLAGRDLPLSAWAPFVFFWQDVFAALIFLVIDTFAKRAAAGWALYGIAVAYIAINVPVSLVLGTPLTWTMMRAAGGALTDSISYYVNSINVVSMLVVLTAGALLPILLARRHLRLSAPVIGGALMMAATGALGETRIDARGLQRNAFGALAGTTRIEIHPSGHSFVDSDANGSTRVPATENLDHLRGTAKGRHVVFIVLESTAARYLGLYGAAIDPMPNLTELSQQGIVFDAAYAVYPESIKGLFSTLCSRYPAVSLPAETHARVPCASLAQQLARAGYRTALFHSGRFGYLGMAPMIADRGFEVMTDAGAIGGNVRSSFGVDEPSTVAKMLEWIDSLAKDESFFLMYLPVAGHHPYAAPDEGPFDVPGDFGRYLNSLHYGDAAIGELLKGLRARQLHDRTLFVIQGDHGEAFGQHPDNFAHSLFIYDENVRVPLVIAAPGLTTAHLRTARVASAIDTAPTILDLLGHLIPAVHQGRSLLMQKSRPAFFYTDYSLGWLGLREGCWKYLHEIDSNRSKLFDVCRDPDETHDLSGDVENRVRAYRNRVRNWAFEQQALVRAGR